MTIKFKSKEYSVVPFIVVPFILCALLVIVLFCIYLGTEDIGNFGDSVGGIIGVGLSFYGVYLLSQSIQTQNKNIALQSGNIEKQNKALDYKFLEQQVKEMEKLSSQIVQNAEIIATFNIQNEKNKKSAIWDMSLVFINYFDEVDVLLSMNKTEIFKTCFREYKHYFSPYFIRIKSSLEKVKQSSINKNRQSIIKNIDDCISILKQEDRINNKLMVDYSDFKDRYNTNEKDSTNQVFKEYKELFTKAIERN